LGHLRIALLPEAFALADVWLIAPAIAENRGFLCWIGHQRQALRTIGTPDVDQHRELVSRTALVPNVGLASNLLPTGRKLESNGPACLGGQSGGTGQFERKHRASQDAATPQIPFGTDRSLRR